MISQYAQPRMPVEFRLDPEVQAALGRTSAEAHSALTHGAKFLLALNAKAARTGSPVFAGVGLAEKARRRAAGKRQRAARKVNR